MKIRAGDTHDPDPERPSITYSRCADPGPHEARSTYSDEYVSRQFRQFLPCDPRSCGRLNMSTDFLLHDNGEPDATGAQAEQHALEDLPVEVLSYLLGSRYCETDRLSNTAWSLFGHLPKGWPLGRRSATTSTIGSCSVINTRVQPKQCGMPIAKDAACAETSPTSPSRYAAA